MHRSLCFFIAIAMLFSSFFGLSAFAAGDPTFKLDNVSGRPGDKVNVDVKVKNNPGIIMVGIDVAWDDNVLELVDATNGTVFSGSSVTVVFSQTLKDNPYHGIWLSVSTKNHSDDGALMHLTFKIKKNAPNGKTPISLTYKTEDVCDVNLVPVHFKISNGSVTVTGSDKTADPSITPTPAPTNQSKPSASPIVKPGSGDANGDGKTNTGDAALILRYSASMMDFDENQLKVSDFNGDGKVNTGDASSILKFVVGL